MATQTTINTSSTTYTNKEFYDRDMLENAETVLVHARFGQKRSIPKGNGKHVEFRKWVLFTVDTAALELVEGVTPSSQNISQTKVEATVKQYGAYVEVSDVLDLTAYDPVIGDMAELLGEQVGTALDWVTRDAMIAGASVQYAGGRTSMLGITANDKLTVTEVRKAVRTLKKSKARRFTEGGKPHFVCIVDPDCVYDLQGDSMWQDAHKYTNAEPIYSGEIGRLYGVIFTESTEGYVSKQAVNNIVDAAVTSGTSFVLKNDPTPAEVTHLSTPGKKVKVGDVELTISATNPYTAATKTVNTTTTFTAQAGLAADAIVYSEDAGAVDSAGDSPTYEAVEVHHSLIFGADAYGVIDIASQGNVQSIIKPFGSGDDPLNQRATVACKVMAYCAKVLNSLWIIDIMSASS